MAHQITPFEVINRLLCIYLNIVNQYAQLWQKKLISPNKVFQSQPQCFRGWVITSPHGKIGKERKIATTDRRFNIFGVARKSIKGVEIEKKRGLLGKEDPISHKGSKRSLCYFNRQINEERHQLLPSLKPWKTNAPKSYV